MFLAGKLTLTFMLFQGRSLNIGEAYLYLSMKSIPAEQQIRGLNTHVLGKAAGSLRSVKAACTMRMGVATYPHSV